MADGGIDLGFGSNNPLHVADKLEAAYKDLSQVETALHNHVADQLTNASMEIAESGRAIDAKVSRMLDLSGKDVSRVNADLNHALTTNLGQAGEGIAAFQRQVLGTSGVAANPSPSTPQSAPCANAIPGEQSFDMYVSCGTGNLYAIPHGRPAYNSADQLVLSCVTSASTYQYAQENQAYWLNHPPSCTQANPPPFGGPALPVNPQGQFGVTSGVIGNPVTPSGFSLPQSSPTPGTFVPPRQQNLQASPASNVRGLPKKPRPTRQGGVQQLQQPAPGIAPQQGPLQLPLPVVAGLPGQIGQAGAINVVGQPGQPFVPFNIVVDQLLTYNLYRTCPDNVLYYVQAGNPPHNAADQFIGNYFNTKQLDLIVANGPGALGLAPCATPGGDDGDGGPDNGGPGGGIGGDGGPVLACPDGQLQRPDGTCYVPCDPLDPNCCPQQPPPPDQIQCNWQRPCAPQSLELMDALLWGVDVDGKDYKEKSIQYLGFAYRDLIASGGVDDLGIRTSNKIRVAFGLPEINTVDLSQYSSSQQQQG